MEQREVMEFEDIEALELLNSPIRVRILRHLLEPATVKDVAENLGVPATRLYYHVNLLESAGIIATVETRKVGAMLQKVYQTTARNFRPSPRLPQSGRDPVELARIAVGVVLDGARVDAEEALAAHFEHVRDDSLDEVHGAFGRTITFFTEEEAEEFAEKLGRFIEEEFDKDDTTEGEEYGLTFAFFPLAGLQKGDGR
jgi:DNA-binding transcriptional ArsR family regulator